MPSVKNKQPNSLFELCSDLVLKYMHHVVWRQLDPPRKDCHGCFKPTELDLQCSLPPRKKLVVRDPKIFRKNLAEIRKYLSSNLVIPVHQSLTNSCQKFVSENRLKYGDVVLYLAFQDKNSRALEVTAKQIIFKKWKVRERMCLIRTLVMSKKLVRLFLPGKIDDEMLQHIAGHCHNLEELDISMSYITDKGLLAICGVVVEDVRDDSTDHLLDVWKEKLDESPEEETEETELAAGSGTGRRKRKAAMKASRILDIKKNCSIGFLRKLAIGQTVSKELEESFSLLASKMKPYISKRLQQGETSSALPWKPDRAHLYTFNSSLGCPRLKYLDLTRTNYPKRSLDVSGKMIITLGITRDAVLASLILLEQLCVLKWADLGEILQLYEMVVKELTENTELLELRLNSVMDTSTTLDKLQVTQRICPDIHKLDISMFNFSFAEEDFVLGAQRGSGGGRVKDKNHWLTQACNIIFNLKDLKDLEVEFMDDSQGFTSCIRNVGGNLTRLCLNKMISISFNSMTAIKSHCVSLQVLELFVDNITTSDNSLTLEQAITEAAPAPLLSLQSLKLGGKIYSGSVLRFLISGCPRLRMLCYTPYSYQDGNINDAFIEQLFFQHPCPELEAFCFEKCFLSEQTFFHLLNILPAIKYIGNMSEWTIDRRARLGIRAFIKGNNIDVDVDSIHGYESDFLSLYDVD